MSVIQSHVLTLTLCHCCAFEGMLTLLHAKSNQMEPLLIHNFINFPGPDGHVTGSVERDEQKSEVEAFYTRVAD